LQNILILNINYLAQLAGIDNIQYTLLTQYFA